MERETDTGTCRQRLGNAADAFDVTVLGAERQAVRTVLFAAGRGGNPLRHRPLLEHLATLGCRVVAPHFDHLPSPLPSGPELRERCRRLQTAAAELADRAAPAIGVGHSIGAALLLALAGADLETVDGERLSPGISRRLERLALMAPPADFFRRPGATSEALRSQGETARADEVRRFVRNLPPARTEREWLRAAHIDQAKSLRTHDRGRAR